MRSSVETWHALTIASIFLAFSWTPAFGQGAVTNAAPKLSLADVRRLALLHNWDLLAAKTGVAAAASQLMQAKEFPNPTLGINTTDIAGHGEATSIGNAYWDRSYDTIVTVSQLIEIAGKRRNRQAAAREGVRGAKARFYDAKRILEQAITKAYLAFLLAEENVRTLTQSSGYMQREADIAHARNKAGDLSDSDTKQILINAEQYQLQAESAAANASQARAQLEVLLGNPPPPPEWTPSDSLELLANESAEEIAPPPASGARPDVLAADADLRAAEANLKLQRALRVPDPTVQVDYERNPVPPGPPPPDTFGVGVSFPLPIWNRNSGAIHAAEAAREQSEVALGKARAQAMFDMTNAQIAYHEASQRSRRYQQQIGPQASQVRESVSFAYEKGGASLVDLLDAERTDNDVRLATAQALSDTASAAADLRAAQTVLSSEDLNQR